jgi:hypothetical protein
VRRGRHRGHRNSRGSMTRRNSTMPLGSSKHRAAACP